MTKENEKNPNKGKEKEIFAPSKKSLKETILELKNQLAAIPATENFRAEREKIKIKLTSYEIMATPAANDFLNDILAERKKLLPAHGVFSFAQILAREQFYRNWNLPAEINNLIEKEVWNLSWPKVEQPTENSLVFFSDLWFTEHKSPLLIRFPEEVKIGENHVEGVVFYTGKSLEEWFELLELNAEKKEITSTGKIFSLKPTKFEVSPVSCEMGHFYLSESKNLKFTNLTKKEKIQAELTKEIFWLLRILRKNITLAEIAPAGLREQQEFIQNHFKREFTELHQNNPQILAQVEDLPWYNFHPLDADIPKPETTSEAPQLDLNLDEPNEQELENSQQNSEQAQKLAEEIVANIHHQAEEAVNESVYNPPLSFDAPRGEYRPPKECADLYCHITVAEEQKYCPFHRWEIATDERLNAERAKVFPNLPPRKDPTPEPRENQKPDLRTTVETDSESETEKSEPGEEVGNNLNEISRPEENSSEILSGQAGQGTAEENERTGETEQKQPREGTRPEKKKKRKPRPQTGIKVERNENQP